MKCVGKNAGVHGKSVVGSKLDIYSISQKVHAPVRVCVLCNDAAAQLLGHLYIDKSIF